MHRILAALVLSYLIGSTAFSQQLITDSADIRPRQFSSERITKYKNDKSFQYEKSLGETKSDWTRFWEWVGAKIGVWLGVEGLNLGFLLLVGSAVVILILCIISLRGQSKGGLLSRRNSEGGSAYKVGEENFDQINFEEEIKQTIYSKNFRLAVRLLYLQTLKNLADKGFITWRANKTNWAYLEELDKSAYWKLFGDLTIQFENNWYGALPIEEKEFSSVANRFQLFNNELLKM